MPLNDPTTPQFDLQGLLGQLFGGGLAVGAGALLPRAQQAPYAQSYTQTTDQLRQIAAQQEATREANRRENMLLAFKLAVTNPQAIINMPAPQREPFQSAIGEVLAEQSGMGPGFPQAKEAAGELLQSLAQQASQLEPGQALYGMQTALQAKDQPLAQQFADQLNIGLQVAQLPEDAQKGLPPGVVLSAAESKRFTVDSRRRFLATPPAQRELGQLEFDEAALADEAGTSIPDFVNMQAWQADQKIQMMLEDGQPVETIMENLSMSELRAWQVKLGMDQPGLNERDVIRLYVDMRADQSLRNAAILDPRFGFDKLQDGMTTIYREALQGAAGIRRGNADAGLISTPQELQEGYVRALVNQRVALRNPDRAAQQQLYQQVIQQVSQEHPEWTKTQIIDEAERRIDAAVAKEPIGGGSPTP